MNRSMAIQNSLDILVWNMTGCLCCCIYSLSRFQGQSLPALQVRAISSGSDRRIIMDKGQARLDFSNFKAHYKHNTYYTSIYYGVTNLDLQWTQLSQIFIVVNISLNFLSPKPETNKYIFFGFQPKFQNGKGNIYIDTWTDQRIIM